MSDGAFMTGVLLLCFTILYVNRRWGMAAVFLIAAICVDLIS